MKKTKDKKRNHIIKNLRHKLVAGLSIFTVLTNTMAFAASTTEKELEQDKNDKKQVTNKLNQTKQELEKVNKEKKETQKEVNSLSSQIESYESEIEKLDAQIEKSNKEIKETTEELDELQNKIVEKKKLLDERLVTMYQNGNTSILEFILSSESISDLFSKYYAAEQIAACDQKLIEQVEKEKKEQEELKKELDEKLDTMQETKESRDKKVTELNRAKGKKEKEVSELNSEAKDLTHDIKEYQNQAKQLDAAIKKKEKELQSKYEDAKNEYIEENGTSSVNFIKPIVGYNITTGLYYSDGRYHGAVDYSGSGIYGKPVRAVADGIVITAVSLTRSYGRHVMIKHYNGLYTLYAHGSALNVKEGQKVKQGQTIMYVGSSGNSTGPHLHFEVRTGPGYSTRVDPRKYLP